MAEVVSIATIEFAMAKSKLHVTGLHVYPVKGCRGIPVREAKLTVRGFEHDREWMIVDRSGQFLSQRQHPLLARFATALSADALLISLPGGERIEVDLRRRSDCRVVVQIWGHECEALDEGDAAAERLSAAIGETVRLVRFDPAHRRLSSREWTGIVDAENRFTDGYPFLIVSEESLADLNARLPQDARVAMDRFRPNVVIRGGEPFGEDRLASLHVDDIELRPVKPCTRCQVTTTDQQSGEVSGKEPLRTLATFRRNELLGGVTFGMNTILAGGAGRHLRVGMELQSV